MQPASEYSAIALAFVPPTLHFTILSVFAVKRTLSSTRNVCIVFGLILKGGSMVHSIVMSQSIKPLNDTLEALPFHMRCFLMVSDQPSPSIMISSADITIWVKIPSEVEILMG